MPNPFNQLLAKIKPPKKSQTGGRKKEGGNTFGAGVPTLRHHRPSRH